MIRCVATSPSVDVTYLVGRLVAGEVHRPDRVLRQVGGKGVNVARVVQALGGSVRAAGVFGGPSGAWCREAATVEGLLLDAVDGDHETRTCVSICSGDGTGPTEVYEPAPPVGTAPWKALVDLLDAERASLTTLSGSLPPDIDAAGLARLADAAGPGLLAVDLHGPTAATWLGSGPGVDVLKVNAREAAALLGILPVHASDPEAVTGLARLLAERTSSALTVVTAGEHGAIAVTTDGVRFHLGTAETGLHPVGSGDAFLAALVLGLTSGSAVPDALAVASAAAAVNARALGAGVVDPAAVAELAAAARLEARH